MKIKNVLINFKPELPVVVKGRIIAKRFHRVLAFIDIRELDEKIQIIVGKKKQNQWNLNLGDIVEVKGITAFSKTKEKSIISKRLKVVVPCREVLPIKTGLVPKGGRITFRHEDFILNPELIRFFANSSNFIFAIRRKLFKNDYFEFDTGTLQPRFDAGFAKPFQTHMNTNGKNYFLRLTSEIRLKQLITSGFEKVFELGKSFRNEGTSPINNPEFTLLEIYAAFETCENLALVMEKILKSSIKKAFGEKIFSLSDGIINFEKPWRAFYKRGE